MPRGVYEHRPFSLEHRARLGAAQQGKHHSAETRAKMSAAHRGRSVRGIGFHHSEETRAKIGIAHRGRVHSAEQNANFGAAIRGRTLSPEWRAKIAETTARNHAAGVYFRGPTKLELALRGLLTSAGFNFQEQVRFGRYVVDAWVPSRRLVFEADGSFWYHHQDKEREARRDAYLMDRDAVAVVHLTEEDLIGIDKEES